MLLRPPFTSCQGPPLLICDLALASTATKRSRHLFHQTKPSPRFLFCIALPRMPGAFFKNIQPSFELFNSSDVVRLGTEQPIGDQCQKEKIVVEGCVQFSATEGIGATILSAKVHHETGQAATRCHSRLDRRTSITSNYGGILVIQL